MRPIMVTLAILLLSACATSGAKGTSSRADRNVITAEEISQSTEHNAYNVIRVLRPGMLVTRGNTSITHNDPGIVVFLDGQRFGDLSSLQGIEASSLKEIRYLTASQAQARFGTGYPQGVISLTSKAG